MGNASKDQATGPDVDLMDIVRVRANPEAADYAEKKKLEGEEKATQEDPSESQGGDMLDAKEESEPKGFIMIGHLKPDPRAVQEDPSESQNGELMDIVRARANGESADEVEKKRLEIDSGTVKMGVGAYPVANLDGKSKVGGPTSPMDYALEDQDMEAAEKESGDGDPSPPSANPAPAQPTFNRQAPVPTPQSQAGAFSAAPGEGTQRRANTSASAVGINLGGPASLVNLQHGAANGLSVAQPVQEEAIPRASQDDNNKEQAREATRKFRSRVFGGIFVLTVVIIGVVLVSVLVPQKDPKEDSTQSPTPSPAYATTYATFEDKLLSLLPEETSSIVLTDPESPQALAFNWTLEDQYYNEYPTSEHTLQRYVLATLYFATKGDDWMANEGWLNHTLNECEWYNADSFGMQEALKVQVPYFLHEFRPPASERCNEDGIYQHLWLDANDLMGTIPEELFLMTSLITIGAGFNRLQGTISTHFGDMKNLLGFYLPYNELTGTIPTQFGLLSDLQVANFFVNALTGKVPDELFHFPNMSSWAFTSASDFEPFTIPSEVGLMTNMHWFAPNECNGYGQLPTEIGRWSNLLGFWMGGREFSSEHKYTGTIPSEVGLWTNLLSFEINHNALTGAVPSEVAQMAQLNYFDVHNNSLSGPLPLELETLTNLENILLFDNDFSGVVPEGLCNLNGSCYSYPSHCGQLEPIEFDCSEQFCGCGCPCNKTGLN